MNTLRDRIGSIGTRLGARAIGIWRVQGSSLEQVAFVAGPGLDEQTARSFEERTASVPLDWTDLGIVKAAVDGRVSVSVAAVLHDEAGSGHWLRAFGAKCSIAFPHRDARGRLVGIISVALADDSWDTDRVVAELQTIGEDLMASPSP
jgi:hypothetical protein